MTAVVTSSVGSTVVMVSGLPSGSESLARAWTETVTPGRTVTSSAMATGFRAPSSLGLMPTRTIPVALAPIESMTVYVKVSVPAE